MSTPESRSSRRARLEKVREAALHRKVLARHLPSFNGRWTRRQWAHASLFATLGALLAAIVPAFSAPALDPLHAALKGPRTTPALALPALPVSRNRNVVDPWPLVTVESGQTPRSLFQAPNLPPNPKHTTL